MFDLEKLEKNCKKSINVIQTSSFYKFIHEDIIDRLDPLDKSFEEILIIKPALKEIITEQLESISKNSNIQYISNLDKELPKDKFDLIIFPFGFHWINDVKSFLNQINLILKDDGVFICSFPGGGSLRNLRRKLIELEILYKTIHTPHISPFIQFEHITPLLQQSGFVENIIDMEALELECNSPLDLMKAIKSHGEANILKPGASYSITKQMYSDLQKATKETFSDYINLITFIATPKKNTIKLKPGEFSIAPPA
jgi:SAM-dependent methyltransferase